MSEIAQVAYTLLYEKIGDHELDIRYSSRFKPFNANVRKQGKRIVFSLSHLWRDVNPEIVIGLIQHLLLRLNAEHHRTTSNIELYNAFIKNLASHGERETDPKLNEIFERINERYFSSGLETPNLVFEGRGRRTLATYNYHDDTIRVSNVFRNAPIRILEFLIYHECLHKLLKYEEHGQRNRHHTARFRRMERMFEGFETIDDEIGTYLRSK